MTDNKIKEQFLYVFEKNIGIIIKISRVYAKVEQDREDLIDEKQYSLPLTLVNGIRGTNRFGL